MIEMEHVKIETTGTRRIIEVTFKHEHKQINEGFVYYVPSKFYPLFSRYLKEVYEDTVVARNVQFLKNWNQIGKRRVQNTGKNNVNILQVATCKILGKSNNSYSSHCWRRSAATNCADAEVSLINLKRHGQWQSGRVVEGYRENLLPLPQERLKCLLPAEESEQVGQVNSENNMQAIERFDLNVDLFNNNNNLAVAPLAENEELTPYGFCQFDVPDMRVDMTNTTNTGVPVLRETSINQTIQVVPQPNTIAAYKQPNSVMRQTITIKQIV